MKLKLLINDGVKMSFSFSYEEAKKIGDFWSKLGLEKRTISNFLGRSIKIDAYIDIDNKLINAFNSRLSDFNDCRLINDLNKDFISWVDGGLVVNIGVFRVIDRKNKNIEVPIDKFLNVLEFKKIIEVCRFFIDFMFNGVIGDIDVKIVKKVNKK